MIARQRDRQAGRAVVIRVFAEGQSPDSECDCFIDNILVQIHLIIEIIGWTGLAPLEFEFPFPGSLISTFLVPGVCCDDGC